MIRINIKKQLHTAEGVMQLVVDEEIRDGRIVALYGPSGAGKTTLLRILAGLTMPDDGSVIVDDEPWFDKDRDIQRRPQKRELGFVFQDYALFPHMSVRGNLLYADARSNNGNRVDELLELVDLGELRDRKPATLSGGQQQRVALARALVRMPKLLLLDEPLSALDRAARLKLQDELLSIHRKFQMTIIIVTHDVAEIFRLCTDVIVLDRGRVIKRGTPGEVFGGNTVSGKFKFIGEIVEIKKADIVFIVSVLVGNEINKVVATEKEAVGLSVGDKVVLSSKAFNPLIIKLT